MDDLVQLEQLLSIERTIEAGSALNLVTITEKLKQNRVKSSYPLIKKIDQILNNIQDKSNYPAKVRQHLKWFIRAHLNQT